MIYMSTQKTGLLTQLNITVPKNPCALNAAAAVLPVPVTVWARGQMTAEDTGQVVPEKEQQPSRPLEMYTYHVISKHDKLSQWWQSPQSQENSFGSQLWVSAALAASLTHHFYDLQQNMSGQTKANGHFWAMVSPLPAVSQVTSVIIVFIGGYWPADRMNKYITEKRASDLALWPDRWPERCAGTDGVDSVILWNDYNWIFENGSEAGDVVSILTRLMEGLQMLTLNRNRCSSMKSVALTQEADSHWC